MHERARWACPACGEKENLLALFAIPVVAAVDTSLAVPGPTPWAEPTRLSAVPRPTLEEISFACGTCHRTDLVLVAVD